MICPETKGQLSRRANIAQLSSFTHRTPSNLNSRHQTRKLKLPRRIDEIIDKCKPSAVSAVQCRSCDGQTRPTSATGVCTIPGSPPFRGVHLDQGCSYRIVQFRGMPGASRRPGGRRPRWSGGSTRPGAAVRPRWGSPNVQTASPAASVRNTAKY